MKGLLWWNQAARLPKASSLSPPFFFSPQVKQGMYFVFKAPLGVS